jgi:hypothetical protein
VTHVAQVAQVSGIRYPLVAVTPRASLGLETFARVGGVHPEFVRRLVALGLLEAGKDSRGALRFAPGQLAVLARIRRLHVGLALNYTAIGVVLDLLDRIEGLERVLRTRTTGRSDVPWT